MIRREFKKWITICIVLSFYTSKEVKKIGDVPVGNTLIWYKTKLSREYRPVNPTKGKTTIFTTIVLNETCTVRYKKGHLETLSKDIHPNDPVSFLRIHYNYLYLLEGSGLDMRTVIPYLHGQRSFGTVVLG